MEANNGLIERSSSEEGIIQTRATVDEGGI